MWTIRKWRHFCRIQGKDREKTFAHYMKNVTSETGLERWWNLEMWVWGKFVDTGMKEDWWGVNAMFRKQGMVQFGCTRKCLRWSKVKNNMEIRLRQCGKEHHTWHSIKLLFLWNKGKLHGSIFMILAFVSVNLYVTIQKKKKL